jgi:hypothetical protein
MDLRYQSAHLLTNANITRLEHEFIESMKSEYRQHAIHPMQIF